ncbi:hypothetical protein L914_18990 [Phytophthora nicotianae]|uniref:BZIP domain-containing protein n=1 Tax=Phytophthora nicotianae TaxID=4792 RepID=W2MBS0_PHYNI|nr:hypothetical protein L914_18990 [Phytophthora nicotianae]
MRARPLTNVYTAVSSSNITGEFPGSKSFQSTPATTAPDVSKRTSHDPVDVNATPLSVDYPNDLDAHKRKKSSTLNMTRKRQPMSFTDTDEEDVELRRSRRRVNMQRYRNKIRMHADTLEADVQQLREEIQKLQLKHHTLLATSKKNTAWGVAAEYFRLFPYGLRGGFTSTEPHDLIEAPSSGSSEQRGFLIANMAADVIGPKGCGLQKLVEGLRKLTLYLPTMSTQLVRLETGPRDSIIASTRVEVTITANAIRLAFPHLIHNKKRSRFASMLQGQQLVTQGVVHFEWDSDSSRVTLLQSKADLLTPMLKILGDLETVASVFQEALITPECTLSSKD